MLSLCQTREWRLIQNKCIGKKESKKRFSISPKN